MNLPEKIREDCDGCLEEQVFVLVGEYNEESDTYYYQCTSCKSIKRFGVRDTETLDLRDDKSGFLYLKGATNEK